MSDELVLRDLSLMAAVARDLDGLRDDERQRAVTALRQWDLTRRPGAAVGDELAAARAVVRSVIAPNGPPLANPRLDPNRCGVADPHLLAAAGDELRAGRASARDVARAERELARWAASRQHAPLPFATQAEALGAVRGIVRASLNPWLPTGVAP